MTVRTITEDQWKSLKKETHNTIFAIIESLEVLSNHIQSPGYGKDTTPKMCAGLYTHAVEEYGKLLYLKGLSPANGKVDIEYENKFKNHKFKFNLTLNNLPQNCNVLREAPFDSNVFDDNVFDATDTEADWETRLTILNTDIDNQGNVVAYPLVDEKLLPKVISNFKTEMFGVKI